MTKRLFGQLATLPLAVSEHQSQPTQAQSHLIGLINYHVNPPAPLSLDDVHIRAMRLVSNQVNDHGGRFPREEHEHLCELLVDSPVMIGHDHSTLPVARNFAARCVDEGERSWVEVWFYWLKGDGPKHDQLAADIDAGVVKEGSIGFEFALPQCSICGEDIRTCEHIPDFEYDGRVAHYEYRNIIRVLETSLVYRGATPNTRIVKYPLFSKLQRARRAVPLQVQNESRRGTACPALAADNHTLPTHLRVSLASFRELRSFYCPARSDLWPRSVFDFRAGHRPLPRQGFAGASPAKPWRGRVIR